MRKATFEVPTGVIGEFAEKLIELELNNTIVGTNDDNDVEIEIKYRKDESEKVDELEDYLDELLDSAEEEDD